MATPQRRAGIIYFTIGGVQQDAKGVFSYNVGSPKRDPIIGADRVHGFRETPQVPMIEGAITKRRDLDVKALTQIEDETVMIEFADGGGFTLRNAWYAGEGTVNLEEAEIPILFQGMDGEELI